MKYLKTGKLGLELRFYAALAFALAIFGQLVPCLLVLGFVLLVERDEWTSRQCIQAVLLQLLGLVAGILQWAASLLVGVVSNLGLTVPTIENLRGYLDFITSGDFDVDLWIVLAFGLSVAAVLLYLYVLAWSVAGVLRTLKGREAAVPTVHTWAWAAYNKAVPVVEEEEAPEEENHGFKPDDEE